MTASDGDVLSAALVAYLGCGRERVPRADAAAADAAAARNGTPSRLGTVEHLVAESLAVPVEWTRTSLGDAGRQVARETRHRHPQLSDVAATALGWNFTFQWR